MKTNALLAFFFFLAALFASTRAADEYVRDSDGHIVHSGSTYYFVPQEVDGAAIVGASIENPNGCSLAVVEKLMTKKGNATLIQSMVRSAYITTNRALLLSFDPLPSNTCTKRPEWIVVTDAELEKDAVMVGDPSQYDDPVAGMFSFQSYNSAKHQYTLCFGSTLPYSCEPIAIKTDVDGNRRLILAKNPPSPLVLKLVKTSGDSVASHLSMVV